MKLRLSEIFRRNPYRPTTRRQRLAILGVTLATVVILFSGLFAPHLRWLRFKIESRHPPLPACAPGQTEGCIGGTQGVMLIPATPATPAAPASR